MSMHSHSNTIHNSQKVEIAQMFINRWTDKKIVIYTYSEILFSHKKELFTNIYHNMDISPKYYAKWKKLI